MLDITAEQLWTKLGEHIGPENVALIRQALDALTGAWEFIKDVQENGISAVWRFLDRPALEPLEHAAGHGASSGS